MESSCCLGDDVESTEAAAMNNPTSTAGFVFPIVPVFLDSLKEMSVIEPGEVPFHFSHSEPITDIFSKTNVLASLHIVECSTFQQNLVGPIMTIPNSI